MSLTVWYNSKCPVCDAGISGQKRKLVEAVKQGAIEFRDINLEPEALASYSASLNDIRRRLHAVDEKGTLFVGAPACAEIWKHTPGEEWLGKLISLPVLSLVAAMGYNLLAKVLFAWNVRRKHW